MTLLGGAGFTYGSGSYMRNNFGITPADAAASGLGIYTPRMACATCVAGWCSSST